MIFHGVICFNCIATRNPHGIWLSATSGMRIFSYEQAFRFGLIFQKTTKSEQKQTIGKQEIHTTVQALNFIFLNHQSHEEPRIKPKTFFRQEDRINRRVEGHGLPDRAGAERGSLTEAQRHRGESERKC